jgi:DNA-binding transcriptional LysR family regulator
MTQHDIKTFLVVVRCKNFSKAAELLFTTQTTVSHRISALEKELGYPLISRRQGYRSIELTPQGLQFVPLAEQWMTLWDTSLAIKDTDHRPVLTIGATNRLNGYFLPPFFNHISQANQNFVADIRSYHSVEIASLIERRDLDVGFISTEAQSKNMNTVPFLKENIVMICQKGNYYKEEFIHPYSLNIQHEVRFASNHQINTWHDHWWDRNKQPYVYVDTATIAVHHLNKPPLWTICPYSVATSLEKLYPIEIHKFAVEVPSQMSFLVYPTTPRPDKVPLIEDFLAKFRQYYISKSIAGFLL